jgi:ribosomal subunit interface protein
MRGGVMIVLSKKDMELILQSPGLDISEKTEAYIRNRFEQLKRLYPRIIKCEVAIKMEKGYRPDMFRLEAKLHVPTRLLFASKTAETIEQAAGETVEDLKHQLSRYKTRFEILL